MGLEWVYNRFDNKKRVARRHLRWLRLPNKKRIHRRLGTTFVIILIFLILWWRFNTVDSQPYSPLERKIFIAANFYNNENILPNFCEQLLDLLQTLKSENVYVSIFENGSKDNTKFLLRTLQSTLNTKGIANTVITDDTPKDRDPAGRISYLSKLRNRLLEPLLEQAENGNNFDNILFFNDVIWSASDILSLLQTNDYNYDAACAMDFYWTFYDTFATRELPYSLVNYHPWPPTSYFPYFYGATAQQNISNGDPIQMFSCWNGVVIMNAEPFVKHGVRFRALLEAENSSFVASECCLVYSDFRRLGYDKVFINPNVKVSYEYRFYLWSKYLLSLIDRFFFKYFNHPTPPSSLSDAGIRMHEMMVNAEMLNVTELDRVCVDRFD